MISANASFLINAVLALGHFAAAFAVLGILLGEDGAWSVPVSFRYNVWNETGVDTGKFVISSATISVTEKFYPGYALIFCSFISGFHHLVAALITERYLDDVRGGFNLYRWLDYAFSASVMVLANEVLWLAPAELSLLIGVFVIQFFIVISGGLAVEKLWADGEPATGFLVLFQLLASSVVFVLFWLRYFFILYYGDMNPASNSHVPLFVYIILLILTVSFTLFPIVFACKLFLGPPEDSRNLYYEVWFWVLSAIAKIPLLTFFATGILARTSRVGFDSNDTLPSDSQSEMAAGYSGIVAGVIILLVCSIIYLDKKNVLPNVRQG